MSGSYALTTALFTWPGTIYTKPILLMRATGVLATEIKMQELY